MAHFDLLTFGSITVDIIVRMPQDSSAKVDLKNFDWCIPMGDKIHIEDMFVAMGGGSGNTARGFARLDLKTAAYGVIGDDAYRPFLLDQFEELDIDTSGIICDKKAPTPFSVILNAYTGHRTVLHRKSDQVCLAPGTLKEAPKAKALYIAHLYEGYEPLLEEVEAWKQKSGGLWVWNPGKTQFKKGIKAYEDKLSLVDILILNREESEQFTQLPSHPINPLPRLTGVPIAHPNACQHETLYDVRSLAQILLDHGVKKIIITDGDRGAQGFTQDAHYFIPSLQCEKVDTLGAGDAFSVGVVGALLHGKDFKTQLRWGASNACGVMSCHGAGNGQLNLQDLLAKT